MSEQNKSNGTEFRRTAYGEVHIRPEGDIIYVDNQGRATRVPVPGEEERLRQEKETSNEGERA